ncbi:MAG: hypothetical protein K8U57_19500 [Planctomycetes bacterium]|nr:hypothetical protein [Planctomycetota bacterium]
MRAFSFLLAMVAVTFVIEGSEAQDKPAVKAEQFTYRVFGLFSADREKDLREVFKELPDIKLVGVNYDEGEITVEMVPAKAFPSAKPEQVLERLDQKVRAETRSTFAVGPRRTIARDKLEQVVIPIVGLDCKACSLAAYEMIARLDGVDRVTASFKEGKVTALIDPTKTDKAKLEDVYRKRGVQLGKP